jgi:hypothetical protein
MAIKGKKKTKFGDTHNKCYARVMGSKIEHWLNGVIKLRITVRMWSNKKARDDKFDGFEDRVLLTTILPEDLDNNIINLSYTRLKLLEEFNNWEDC